jgi:FkbM family methyltransferase
VFVQSVAGLIRYWPRATFAAIRRLPASEWRGFLTAYQRAAIGNTGTSIIRITEDEHPYELRHGTSDFAVFCQVLLAREYKYVPDLNDVHTIVDAGANVGFSTRYLLNRFPGARAIVIEPDVGNLAAARRNLACVADRCEIVHGALWPESGVVNVVSGVFRDGREWSVSVTDAPAANAMSVAAVTLPDLIARFRLSQIDIFKVDIEGAETRLFSANTEFMTSVRCCAIELHDSEASELFHDVCRNLGFAWTNHGETTVAVRNRTT